MKQKPRDARAVYGRDGVWLPTSAEAAAFDAASHALVKERVLMENAGRAAAAAGAAVGAAFGAMVARPATEPVSRPATRITAISSIGFRFIY